MPRWWPGLTARMMREHGYFFRRNAPIALALSLWEGQRVQLPLHRDVRRVRVSADDRVIPAMDPEGRNL